MKTTVLTEKGAARVLKIILVMDEAERLLAGMICEDRAGSSNCRCVRADEHEVAHRCAHGFDWPRVAGSGR